MVDYLKEKWKSLVRVVAFAICSLIIASLWKIMQIILSKCGGVDSSYEWINILNDNINSFIYMAIGIFSCLEIIVDFYFDFRNHCIKKFYECKYEKEKSKVYYNGMTCSLPSSIQKTTKAMVKQVENSRIKKR